MKNTLHLRVERLIFMSQNLPNSGSDQSRMCYRTHVSVIVYHVREHCMFLFGLVPLVSELMCEEIHGHTQ